MILDDDNIVGSQIDNYAKLKPALRIEVEAEIKKTFEKCKQPYFLITYMARPKTDTLYQQWKMYTIICRSTPIDIMHDIYDMNPAIDSVTESLFEEIMNLDWEVRIHNEVFSRLV